jgi:hypothetical protein
MMRGFPNTSAATSGVINTPDNATISIKRRMLVSYQTSLAIAAISEIER